ncbi:MAG TPA: glycosyltransferase [Nitrospira sp.]|nr:glycosyltransferase [Nitrospira sp.]
MKRPIKVLLLAVGLGVGGTESHLLELASRIDRKRFEVVVVSLKPDGVLVSELQSRGVRVISLNGKGKMDIRILFRLREVFQAERPDVVQSFLFWANLAARLARTAHRKLLVISSYHDEVVQEGWFERFVDRLTMGWTEKIVCCSQAVRRSVELRIGGAEGQFAVIPFGVEIGRYAGQTPALRDQLDLREGAPLIGTVCRLVEPKKGLRVLLEAMAQLVRGGIRPSCQLVIVGEGPAEQELRSLCQSLGIVSRVVFAGVRRDIPRLLPLFDVFVLPSLYEGFGIAILEAMAAGRPVVATTVGGIPEFVRQGETGILVKPGDAASLANAISSLLQHPEQAREMGLRGQKVVRDHFGIATVVRQHEQVYESCLAGA